MIKLLKYQIINIIYKKIIFIVYNILNKISIKITKSRCHFYVFLEYALEEYVYFIISHNNIDLVTKD
jgi:hypothetical protein